MSGNAFQDYEPQSLPKLTKRQLKSLQLYGPQAAQTIQDISSTIAPQEQALQLKLLQDYAPAFSKAGTDIAGQEAKAGVANDLATIQGGGQDLVTQLLAVDRAANPEFYSQREVAGKGFTDLISGQDPNKLSGAELANVERGVNRLNARTGNLNTGDATTTAANAMVFGDELGKKRDRFAQSLALFPGLSGASRAPIDTAGYATGKAIQTPNFGQQQYQGQTGNQATQGFLDRAAGTQQTQQNILAGRRNIQDYSEGAVSSVCCFIMIAANEGRELPWWIRFCRDYYYEKEPRVAEGYKRMAKWLVPLMEKSKTIRSLIKYTMFEPISLYGKYLVGESKNGWIMKPIKNFWFQLWRTL